MCGLSRLSIYAATVILFSAAPPAPHWLGTLSTCHLTLWSHQRFALIKGLTLKMQLRQSMKSRVLQCTFIINSRFTTIYGDTTVYYSRNEFRNRPGFRLARTSSVRAAYGYYRATIDARRPEYTHFKVSFPDTWYTQSSTRLGSRAAQYRAVLSARPFNRSNDQCT